jgi:glycosyltransferase involved in cell wall biosynthesis
MKVALVCDWLTNVGGAEKVLLELHHLFPDAPIYTSKYSKEGIDWFDDADVRTGWLQIFPVCLRRFLGVFRQRWFEHLDLSEYDLVISVTGAEAKAVPASKPGARHISYCHVPTQYYWQMYDEYVKNPGFGILNPLVRFCFKLLVKPLRKRDFEAAQKVDQFVTISGYAKDLIAKYYKREAIVVHPPVELEVFKAGANAHFRAASYITTSRQVNWKRIDLAVKACRELKRELLVIGEGPEHNKLVKMSNGEGNIKLLPVMKREELAEYLGQAKGYLFPSLEPFGIAPVEALAAGCPVIAFGEGGALDYVKDGKNGVLFEKQTVKSLKEAILRFEELKFDCGKVSKSVENFGQERFDTEIMKVVNEKAD